MIVGKEKRKFQMRDPRCELMAVVGRGGFVVKNLPGMMRMIPDVIPGLPEQVRAFGSDVR
jgi:hypothetical protein